MSNKLIRVFDNIGFNFVIENNVIKPVSAIKTYNILNTNHVGYLIPYIARNLNSRLFETGVGEIVFDNSGNIVVKRIETISSSNNNNKVDFPSSGNDFYVFANQSSFDKGLNNTIVIDKDSSLDAISALYLVDCSSKSISINLPSLGQSNNIIIELKLIESSNSLFVKDKDGSLVCTLDSLNNYARLASTGKDWVVLNNKSPERMSVQSLNNDSDTFSILSGEMNNAEMYWDSESQRVFIGANSASSADTIIPTSGTYPFIVNNSTNGSDFIVYGSGSLSKNLFFSYDGRVGINIPSGSRPSTVFHIVNTVCQEGLRLENRTSCYPANITLYHKPSTDIASGSVVSQINLSAKNSTGNQTNYAQIESRAVNTTVYGEKGSLDITVVSGVTGIKTIQTTVDSTYVGYSGNRLQINNNGNLLLTNGNSQITVSPQSSITFSSSSVYATGTSYLTTISSQNIDAANLTISNLGSSGLLMASGGRLINSPLSIDSAGALLLPVPANKLLSTTSNGAITGIYTLDDYFLTERDVIWTKYSPRPATACLRQITFTDSVSADEFAAGDQIVILSNGSNIYRRIISLELNGSAIVGLLVDQNIVQNITSNINVYSITKGGYLTMTKSVDEGTLSDSTENILSVRPLTDTVFNSKQKDINFIVYGLDEQPALLIKANSGRVLQPSGIYSPFATTRTDMFPIVVTTGGSGISNYYSSANYNYNISRNLFSGVLSDIGTNGLPSYYGTYDQNGNVAEWVEKASIESRDINEFTAGGSYLTADDVEIGPSGLKSIESLPRMSGFDYVGFRIAGLQGIVDSAAISQATGLNMSFVTVGDPRNIKDSSSTYVKGSTGSYSPIILNNLGVVNNFYRIGKYEITNSQYCKFLNATASSKVVDRKLYDSRMTSSNLGGILRIDTGVYEYSPKPSMINKPVTFVSYLNAIKFINWIHNGALPIIAENNIDYILNNGSYNIYLTDVDTYSIAKGSYRKYWLPELSEWHKAAYYRPVNGNSVTGTSSVSIKRPEPYLVGSGIDAVTNQETKVFANLSVSGWLYADHIMIGDGTIMSSLSELNFTQGGGTDTTNTQTITQTQTPTTNLDDQWNNRNTKSILGTVASCTGCIFSAQPKRIETDTFSLCSDAGLIESDNLPWWCDEKTNGPGWFI
jgi:hypothetical protein